MRYEPYRSIMIASAAIPGGFPPVLIDVEAAGQRYPGFSVSRQLNGDGRFDRRMRLIIDHLEIAVPVV